MSEFDVYITVTGLSLFPNCRRLVDGETVILIREPENEADKFAVAVFGKNGKIGYVANSEKTVREGSFSAAKLCEILENSAKATVVEGTYHDALCKVNNVFDIDKMILKAYEYYNSCEYESALMLFLELCKKYSSVLLLQKTADCLIKVERYYEALPYIEKVLKNEPENKTSLMMYAFSLENTNEIEKAIETYTKLSKICNNEQVELALKRCKERL